jgi:hypothetical protein
MQKFDSGYKYGSGLKYDKVFKESAVVDTIFDLISLTTGDNTGVVFVRGFDSPNDGGGGLFLPHSGTLSEECIGIQFNSSVQNIYWTRVGSNDSRISVSWAGVFPSPNSPFDSLGISSTNRSRLNNLINWCGKILHNPIGLSSLQAVRNSIQFGGGLYDFSGGSIVLKKGVSIFGSGKGSTSLRFNESGTCKGIYLDGGSSYGASSTFNDFTVQNMSYNQSLTSSNIGIHCNRMVRGLNYKNVLVCGFGINVYHTECWEYEFINCTLAEANVHNFKSYGNINTASFYGCRIDDCDGPSNVYIIDPNNSAQRVTFRGGAIQRSQRIAILLSGILSATLDDIQFEGNNRDNDNCPDIWIDGSVKINMSILSNYFTTTGRNGADTNIAINIRPSVTGGSLKVESNSVGGGSNWTHFLKDDSNSSITIRSELNEI